MPSSNRWKQRQQKDPFVKAAQKAHYVSRATYKLLDIDQHFHLFHPFVTVLELGAAPGGWTQILQEKKIQGVSVDLKPLKIQCKRIFIQGDATHTDVQQRIQTHFTTFHGIISDMAPSISGIADVDNARAFALTSLPFILSPIFLQSGGFIISKGFQSNDLHQWIHTIQPYFKKITRTKPKASRKESSELYIVATGYNPTPS